MFLFTSSRRGRFAAVSAFLFALTSHSPNAAAQTSWKVVGGLPLQLSQDVTTATDIRVLHPIDGEQTVALISGVWGSVRAWVFDQSSGWAPLNTATAPPTVQSFSACATRNSVYLFGGWDPAVGPRSEIWKLSQTAGTWDWTSLMTMPDPVFGGKPRSRYCHAMAYDVNVDRIVVYGGIAAGFGGVFGGGSPGYTGSTGGTYLQDTWSFTPSNNTWHVDTGGAPAARANPLCGWSEGPVANGVFMAGGTDLAGNLLNDGMYYWDAVTGWQQLVTSPPPSVTQRFRGTLEYDADRDVTVVAGGIGPLGTLTDTWESSDQTSWTQRTASIPSSAVGAFVGLMGAYRQCDFGITALTVHHLSYESDHLPAFAVSGSTCPGAATPLISGSPCGLRAFVGGLLLVEGEQLLPGSPTLLLLDGAATAIPYGPLGSPCRLYVDPATAIPLAMSSPNPQGYSAIFIPIPNQPSLAGKNLYTQIIHTDPQGPSSLSLSALGTATIGSL